jgi:hypothetical protein
MIFYHRYQQIVLNSLLSENIKRENQNNLLRAFFFQQDIEQILNQYTVNLQVLREK